VRPPKAVRYVSVWDGLLTAYFCKFRLEFEKISRAYDPQKATVDVQKYRVDLVSGSAPATLARSPICASSEGEPGSIQRVIACHQCCRDFDVFNIVEQLKPLILKAKRTHCQIAKHFLRKNVKQISLYPSRT